VGFPRVDGLHRESRDEAESASLPAMAEDRYKAASRGFGRNTRLKSGMSNMPMGFRRLAPLAAALVVGAMLAGCTGFAQTRTQGYDISDDALLQIREGQSKELVTLVLGSPATTNTWGDEDAWYYVETKVRQTAFGPTRVQDRTVLAVYFDKKGKVIDRAVYGKADGRVIAIESRRTPSFGQDRTFLESIIDSI
jgi:outer membrane protein assembly factor BamE (lipoprotein component of BamABCDE complex)